MKIIDGGKQKITRREFIRASSAMSLGMALSKTSIFAEQPEKREQIVSDTLRTRKLGRTGLDVTELSFGGIELGDSALLHTVIERGINLVHTSPGYAYGKSIIAFGRVLKTMRQKVYIALKERPGSRNLENALRKLNTDYVDILVPPMHDVKSISNPELPEEFEKLKKTGKIRFSGFACHKNEKDVMMKAVELGYFDVMLVRYNLENKDDLDPILTLAKEKQNMGFMAMKVTKQLARRRKAEIPAALKEILKNKNVDTLLIGISNYDELNTNLTALSG